jgi:hypothetical protein
MSTFTIGSKPRETNKSCCKFYVLRLSHSAGIACWTRTPGGPVKARASTTPLFVTEFIWTIAALICAQGSLPANFVASNTIGIGAVDVPPVETIG